MQRRRFCEKLMDIGFEIKGNKRWQYSTLTKVKVRMWSSRALSSPSTRSLECWQVFEAYMPQFALILHLVSCIALGLALSTTRHDPENAWRRHHFKMLFRLRNIWGRYTLVSKGTRRQYNLFSPFSFWNVLWNWQRNLTFSTAPKFVQGGRQLLVVCHSLVAVAMALPWCCHVAYGNEPLRR